MDHLPHLPDTNRLWPRVPYLGTEDPTNIEDLEEYLRQTDFDLSFFADITQQHEASSVFQDWFFFGLLKTILDIYKIPLDRSDFLECSEDDDQLYITTDRLQWYIAAWLTTEQVDHDGIDTTCKSPISEKTNPLTGLRGNRQGIVHSRHKRIRGIFQSFSRILLSLDPVAVIDEIYDSVLVLASTLQNTAHEMFRCQGLRLHDTISFDQLNCRRTSAMFESNQWCPRERRIIAELMRDDPAMMYSTSQVDRSDDSHLHRSCTKEICLAYHVSEETYQTRHTETCGGANDCQWLGRTALHQERAFESLKSKIPIPEKLQTMPMVTYRDGRVTYVSTSLAAGVSTHVTEHWGLPFPDYVAISHVWADGLGNPHSNTLPECQIADIQTRVNLLFPDKPKPIPFWMDTLCLPLEKSYRTEVITRMRHIYRAATKVLVLDNSLRRLRNADSLTAETVAIRILCSPWARRLWTLQEAGLLMRAHFLIGNTGTQSFPMIRLSAKNHPNLASCHADIPVEHPLHRLITVTGDRNLRVAMYKGRYQSLKAYREDRFIDNALSSTWSRLEAWFMTMYMDWGAASIRGRVPVFNGIAYRTLSKVSDEAIVSAAMFDKSSASPGKIARTEPDERYRVLFGDLGYIPWRMIFLNQRRYEEYGSRWIPRSLLSQNSADLKSVRNFEGPGNENPPLWPKQATKEGLACLPFAFLIADKLVLDSKGKFRVRLEQTCYQAFAHPAGSSEALSKVPLGELVLLLDRELVSDGPKQLTAVLVTVISRAKTIAQIEEEEGEGQKQSTWQIVRQTARQAKTVMTSCKSRHEALVELERMDGKDGIPDLPEVRVSPDHTTINPDASLAWRVG